MTGLVAVILLAQSAAADNLRCVPALPVFCKNVHVECAGRTELPTVHFVAEETKITFENGEAWPTGSVTHSGIVYRRPDSQDWVRIAPDRRFSQRVFTGKGPVMAYGSCE